MSDIKTLVLMQLRDKMDLSWTKTTKDRIHTIGLSILKFLVVTLVYTGILYALNFLKVVYFTDLPAVMTLVLTFVVLMLVVSDTIGLTESLYFSEDNRVLITLPVKNNKIYISKLLVFFIYELKRSFGFTIPIILGTMINIYIKSFLHFTSFLWCILPIIALISCIVLISSLLSIPALYIYRFVSNFKIAKLILILIGLACYVLVCLSLVQFLPKEINMIQQWPKIRMDILKFLIAFEEYNVVIAELTKTIIGDYSPSLNMYVINGLTIARLGVLIAICVVLYVLVYYASRPIFFNMMSKNFEFNKDSANHKKNKPHSKFTTFNLKEARIAFRTAEILLSVLVTYITIPILIFFLNRLFMAMDKSSMGIAMTYAFNILLMVFPMLLSNSMVASLYSKEGRAGYIKKTKPVNPLLPLTSKLTFNLIITIPSVLTSVIIFGNYVNICAEVSPKYATPITVGQIIMLFFAILLLNYAHIFLSAKMDILNPQNENYATSGNDFINPNETRSSAFGAILAFIYSIAGYLFFSSGFKLRQGDLQDPLMRLLIFSCILACYFIGSYVISIKAMYAQSQE